MREVAMIACGAILVLLSLWGGAWLWETFPPSSPYNFAAFFTSLLTFLAGFGLVATGLTNRSW